MSASEAADLRRQLQSERVLTLDIKVIPRARAAEVAERMANGALKVRVTAAPEKGKANDEVCALLAAFLSIPKGNVTIVFGHTSPQKRVRITL